MKSLLKCGESETLTRKSTTTVLLTWWQTSRHAKGDQDARWWTEGTEQGLPADLVPRRLKPDVGQNTHNLLTYWSTAYMDAINTATFLQRYFDALSLHESETDYWNTIVETIGRKDSLGHSAYEKLEHMLNLELDKLNKDELLAVYRETENGASLDDESLENYSLELVKIELIEELMDKLTSIAWEQTKNSQ